MLNAENLWHDSLRTGIACQSVLEEVPSWEQSGFLLGLLHVMSRWAIVGFAATPSKTRSSVLCLGHGPTAPEFPDERLLSKLDTAGIEGARSGPGSVRF
jgi:hypothetical protein